LGSLRFAEETKEELVTFFSIDSLPSEDAKGSARTNKRGNKQTLSRGPKTMVHSKINLRIQKLLWEQPPCANTKLVPGKLSLCVRMPVMIRHNIATELCITKGQEATMYGWQSQKVNDINTIDMLFVQLRDPPVAVKLDGLLLNVVPLTRNCVTTTCNLPDNSTIQISHAQPDVLPNFAMTNYASQGKC
jgi:hypothetical protein